MSKHQLNKLLIVTVLVVIAAFWASSLREADRGEELGGKPLVENLAKDINLVSAIRIIEGGDKVALTLVKGEKNWTVAERDHYPADMQKVREFLLKLAEADLLEAKTAKKESHAKLGVEDVAAADAKGVRVELEGLKQPVRIVIGNANSQGQSGTFVRRNDEAQSWLAKGTISADRVVGNWLDKNLMDIQSSRIERFELSKTDGKLSGFKSKPEDDKYTIENLPKGKELNSEYEGNSLAAVLASLTIEDARSSAGKEPDLISLVNAKYLAFDGLQIAATGWLEGEKNYVRFSASLDQAKAEAHIAAQQDKAKAEYTAAKAAYDAQLADYNKKKAEAKDGKVDGEAPVEPMVPAAVSDAAKDKTEQLAKLGKEVEDLNARFKGWDFALPAYKFGSINKSMSDLLKSDTPPT